MEEIAMRTKRHVALVAGFLGLCAIAVGIVTHAGCLTIRHPEHAALSALAPASTESSSVLDTELARGRVDVAVRVWHDAYGAALESRSWEGMIAVGDASCGSATRRAGPAARA